MPFLTDQQIEPVLEAAWAHGARQAGYVLLRLPWEVKDLFREWLERNYPLKAKHVMSRVHEMRGGPRQRSVLRHPDDRGREVRRAPRQRFDIACKRIGFNKGHDYELDTTLFRPPATHGQGHLF